MTRAIYRIPPGADEGIIVRMFELLYLNMTPLVPLNGTRAEIYAEWRTAFDKNLEEGTRHIVDAADGFVRGYASYTIRDIEKDVYLNEVQIHPQFQGRGIILKNLARAFLREIEDSPARTVRTYANRLNARSQELLERAGFVIEERVERGIRYQTDRQELCKRFRHPNAASNHNPSSHGRAVRQGSQGRKGHSAA